MIGIEYAFALKFVHTLGASVLFGTGLGIAFFMWMAHRTADVATIAATARIVVVADTVFTVTAVVVQPISGALLAWSIGYALLDGWIAASLILYVVVGVCWLPVVFIQIQLRDLALTALKNSSALPRVSSPLCHLVLARLARVRGGAGDLRADDLEAGHVVG
jgi:uncharacterized membrane protein